MPGSAARLTSESAGTVEGGPGADHFVDSQTISYADHTTGVDADQHAAILTAFSRRDPDKAGRAMRLHIERSRDRLLPAFD